MIDHDRAQAAQDVQHLLQVAFRFPDVLGAKISQRNAGNPDRTGITFGQKCLSGADGAADQITHRRRVKSARGDPVGVLPQSFLGGVVTDDRLQRVARLDECHQSLALPLDHALLQPSKLLHVDRVRSRAARVRARRSD